MPEPKPHLPNDVSIESLLAIFYAEQTQLATFRKSPADQVPEPYARLLNHTSHMTVTVEEYYQDTVDVRVLKTQFNQRDYCREILLSTHRDAKVVQYGIVRLHLDLIPEPARSEILAESKPLGRVLIERQILREVELFDLFRIACGPTLGIAGGATRYINIRSHSLDPLQSRACDRIARNRRTRRLTH
jgi:chorismate-pyruvate lyase